MLGTLNFSKSGLEVTERSEDDFWSAYFSSHNEKVG